MTRPHFTVRTKAGISYDANHIAYCAKNLVYAVSFICSGVLTVIPATEITAIAFQYTPNAEIDDYCGQCDQSITAIFG